MYGIKDFVPPIAGKYRITSGEGARKSKRTTNGARMSSFHHGTDWAGAVPGSKPDIRNITGGKVVWTGKAGGWGNAVIVENPDGYRVQYGHLDSIAVKVGDQVPAGGKIGVMGATGNVTGVHLDLIVTKDGKSINRQGVAFADAPNSISRRAGSKSSSLPSTPSVETSSYLQPTTTQDSNVYNPNTTTQDIFTPNTSAETPTTVLKGAVGLAVPMTTTENKMFSQIADMGLSGGLESIYAEAARAIAGAKDSIESRPIIQVNNPLRTELSSIFDNTDI